MRTAFDKPEAAAPPWQRSGTRLGSAANTGAFLDGLRPLAYRGRETGEDLELEFADQILMAGERAYAAAIEGGASELVAITAGENAERELHVRLQQGVIS